MLKPKSQNTGEWNVAAWYDGIVKRYRMIFHVVIEQAEDGWIVVECPALPGCVSQGKDEKEALDNIKEAITAWLWAEDQKAVSSLACRPDCQPIVVAI